VAPESAPSTRWQVMGDLMNEPDERVAEAVAVFAKRQHQNGRCPLNSLHPNRVHFDMEDGVGEASRWNTLRALCCESLIELKGR